jgi:aspartyl-tRNA(Asn)/glutamyl-tRNA(Gln) amidotransferase subunit A
VASNAVPFAIASDTGDSARRPASFVGVVGYKPTYGLISRYGLMPYAPSLDHVGIIARTTIDVAIVSESLVKFDVKDFTSQKINDSNFYKNIKKIDKLTIGVVKGIEKYLPQNIAKVYLESINLLEQRGHNIQTVPFEEELLKAIHIVYSSISYAEANSC